MASSSYLGYSSIALFWDTFDNSYYYLRKLKINFPCFHTVI